MPYSLSRWWCETGKIYASDLAHSGFFATRAGDFAALESKRTRGYQLFSLAILLAVCSRYSDPLFRHAHSVTTQK